MDTTANHEALRFEFGKNWAKYLSQVNEKKLAIAKSSMHSMLGANHLNGRCFIDIGSGSGIFSLAARRQGASVHSFDYDLNSVACSRKVRDQFFPNDSQWKVEQGSVLDDRYLQRLGKFDVVYSWGVLHHTGDQWRALDNAAAMVADNGRLWIALYNDQGGKSRRWKAIKQAYNWLPRSLRFLVLGPALAYLWVPCLIRDGLRGDPFRLWRTYEVESCRGMSPWTDLIDWVGGYPFEVSKPEEVFEFLKKRGFTLDKLRTCGGSLGCNEFVFVRSA